MDAVEKLRELQGELRAQGDRLEARGRELDKLVERAPEGERGAMGIAAEAFREIVDTGIEFQKGLVDVVLEIAESGFGDEEG